MVMIRTNNITSFGSKNFSRSLKSFSLLLKALGTQMTNQFNLDQFYFVKYVLFARCSYFLVTVDFFVTDSIM